MEVSLISKTLLLLFITNLVDKDTLVDTKGISSLGINIEALARMSRLLDIFGILGSKIIPGLRKLLDTLFVSLKNTLSANPSSK